MTRIALLILLTFSILAGCQKERQNDPFLKGLEQNDKGQYDNAIATFQRQLQADPGNPQLQMALASAYAGRAGLEIDRFWDFAKQIRGPQITPENLRSDPIYLRNQQNLASITPLLPGNVSNDIDQSLLSLAALRTYRARAQVYPYVSKEKRPDIENAVHVLQSENHKGARLYRAILNGVLIRSDLDDGLDFWDALENPFSELISHPLEYNRIFCTPVTGNIFQWMDLQFNRTESISADLQYTYPSDSEQYSAFSQPVLAYQATLPGLQSEFIPTGCPP